MRFIPSRRWVKESIPAYLCCETSPWATIWIKLYVWVCPECKQEFLSLKQVWKELDEWDVPSPSDSMEDDFTSTFRNRFPSAFESEKEAPAPRTGDLILRLAYTTSIVLLGTAVFLTHERTQKAPLQPIAQVSAPQSSSNIPPLNTRAESQVALSSSSSTGLDRIPGKKVIRFTPSRSEIFSSDEHLPSRGVRILTTSLGDAPVSHSRPSPVHSRRTIEINQLPVTGFETLMSAEDERSY
ncbi:MAG: hypothetical protein AMXMBFR75_33110 [Candidatus Hinthialibacteria bacterium]|nr:hypothetical protein [Candidatus Omnitrophota bacterium]